MSPMRSRRPCPGRGRRTASCPNLLKGSEKQCIECEPFVKQAIRKYDKARDQTPGRKFLHSTVWRRIRELKLTQNALCQMCEVEGLTVEAVLVHHVNEDQLCNEESNLMSCCQSCHELIHRKDRYGRNNALQ